LTNHLNWGYRRKPSDTLASRSGLPDITLKESAHSQEWKQLWDGFNMLYKEFLKKNGYGDRLWAVVAQKK
jgi:hypothetical protein